MRRQRLRKDRLEGSSHLSARTSQDWLTRLFFMSVGVLTGFTILSMLQ